MSGRRKGATTVPHVEDACKCIKDQERPLVVARISRQFSLRSRLFLVWGGLDARALFLGAVYPNSHHLALKRSLSPAKLNL